MEYSILVDFGSTFTKAAVVGRSEGRVIFTVRYPSTVKSDASLALNRCMEEIGAYIGADKVREADIRATSSAAGGLRMAVIGLTDHLSISAGKNVAYGAGAKIISVTSGQLKTEQMKELAKLPLEMVLFCGGYENGNESLLLHNAEVIAASELVCPVIYGGNSAVARQIKLILTEKHKECFLIPNIIPRVGELVTEKGEEIIRDLFMKRIVNMKGLGKVHSAVGDEIMPTPKAVMEAGRILAERYGELMIVDIGGATTDIHSYAEQVPGKGARLVGAKEPFAKRTVEGDLGMRESSDAFLNGSDAGQLAGYMEMDPERLKASIRYRVEHTEFVPDSEEERRIDENIAAYAAREAARRHAGRIRYVENSNCNKIQTGKNLMNVRLVIGTGGPIINSRDPKAILHQVIAGKGREDETLLLPEYGEFCVDSDYVMYAAGLLGQTDKELALSVMENSLHLRDVQGKGRSR